jgi:hypothetical protein
MVARVLIAILLVLGATRSSDAHEDRYPMAPAEYRKKAEARFERYRDRAEKHMTTQKFDDAKRASVRKRLATLESTVRARIEKLAADGTISKADADEIKQLGKQGRAAIYKDFALEPDEKPAKKR